MTITTSALGTIPYTYAIHDSTGSKVGDGAVTLAGAGATSNWSFTPTAGTGAFTPFGTTFTPTNTASATNTNPATTTGVYSATAADPFTRTSLTIPTLQLDNTSGSVHDVHYTVFDKGLNPHSLQMEFTQTSSNAWTYNMTESGSTSTAALLSGTVTWTPPAGAVAGFYTYTPAFDSSAFAVGTGSNVTYEILAAPTAGVAPSGTFFNAASAATYATSTTVNPVTFTPPGATASTIAMDVSGLTQYGGATSVQASTQNGNAAGSLDSVAIDTSGMITGKFSNGKSKNLAQVALATFTNPGGLSRSGDSLFTVSNNSGNPSIGTSGTGGRGALTPGTLEQSNVDLAQEFSDMIITQRSFQANSKIITTTDQMLEILANLKQ